jgi:hypothetical protein
MPSHEPSSALWSGAPSRAPVVAKNRWPKRPPLHRYARESGVVGPVERGPLPGPGCREESVAEAATAPQARARVRCRGPCGAGPAPGPRLSRKAVAEAATAPQARARVRCRGPCGAGPPPGPRLSRKSVAEAATAPQARARVRRRGPCGAGPALGPRRGQARTAHREARARAATGVRAVENQQRRAGGGKPAKRQRSHQATRLHYSLRPRRDRNSLICNRVPSDASRHPMSTEGKRSDAL